MIDSLDRRLRNQLETVSSLNNGCRHFRCGESDLKLEHLCREFCLIANDPLSTNSLRVVIFSLENGKEFEVRGSIGSLRDIREILFGTSILAYFFNATDLKDSERNRGDEQIFDKFFNHQ